MVETKKFCWLILEVYDLYTDTPLDALSPESLVVDDVGDGLLSWKYESTISFLDKGALAQRKHYWWKWLMHQYQRRDLQWKHNGMNCKAIFEKLWVTQNIKMLSTLLSDAREAGFCKIAPLCVLISNRILDGDDPGSTRRETVV